MIGSGTGSGGGGYGYGSVGTVGRGGGTGTFTGVSTLLEGGPTPLAPAAVSEAGDLFLYTVAEPVQLGARTSALLPILDARAPDQHELASCSRAQRSPPQLKTNSRRTPIVCRCP
jgi:hypothetical protein